MNAAASAAKRIIRTAPIAKFGAKNTGRLFSTARSCTGARSAPVVPITHGTPASSAARTLATTASGAVKSIAASASSSSTSLWL